MKNNYEIDILPTAYRDLKWWNKRGSNKGKNRLLKIYEELQISPLTGIGKPHALKHDLAGKYSRTIDGENRIVYSIDDDNKVVTIYSAKGHYK